MWSCKKTPQDRGGSFLWFNSYQKIEKEGIQTQIWFEEIIGQQSILACISQWFLSIVGCRHQLFGDHGSPPLHWLRWSFCVRVMWTWRASWSSWRVSFSRPSYNPSDSSCVAYVVYKHWIRLRNKKYSICIPVCDILHYGHVLCCIVKMILWLHVITPTYTYTYTCTFSDIGFIILFILEDPW